MKNFQFLIIILALFPSCGSETQGPDQYEEPSEPEEIITFEKYVENVKTPVRQTMDTGFIVAGGKNGQAWLMKLDKYGEEKRNGNIHIHWEILATLGRSFKLVTEGICMQVMKAL